METKRHSSLEAVAVPFVFTSNAITWPRSNRVILHLATLTLPLLLFGCTRTVTLQPRLIAHLPHAAEVPWTVGVHYIAETRN